MQWKLIIVRSPSKICVICCASNSNKSLDGGFTELNHSKPTFWIFPMPIVNDLLTGNRGGGPRVVLH